jgi:hypothetical protein
MSKDDKKDSSFDGMKPTKPPSIFKMAKTFAGELAKYIKEGAPNVSNKIYLERLETCKKCPHLNKEKFSCNICGCRLETKAKWKTTTCPDNPQRWKPIYLDPKTVRDKEAWENEQKKKQEEKGKLHKSQERKLAIKRARQFKAMMEKRGWDGKDLIKRSKPIFNEKENKENKDKGSK